MKARHYGSLAVAFMTVLLAVLGVRVAFGAPGTQSRQVETTASYSGPHLGSGLASIAAAEAGKQQLKAIDAWNKAVWKAALNDYYYGRWLAYWHQRLSVPPRAPPVVVRHIYTPKPQNAPQAPTAPLTSINSTGSVNGYPCGGDLPSCCTLQMESHGTPTAQNPTSSASGLWQFLDSTWGGYGGYAKASYAPASVQNERARQLYAGGAGWSAWKGDHCYPGG